MRLYLLLFLSILISLSLIAGVDTTSTPAVAQSNVSIDWPQVQRDQTRSARTPHGVIPPYVHKWTWANGQKWTTQDYNGKIFSEEVPVLSQPIIGDGKLYVGSFSGKIFAIRADSGETAWSYTTGASILHTGAFAQQTVFFGSTDGYFYALRSTDGALLWKKQTGSIASAPLLLSDRVCIGARTGTYSCFSFSGEVLFSATIGAPIYHTSSASNDGTRIYFAGEDMIPRCLLARPTSTSGTVCPGWSPSVLPGQSMVHYWPVVAGNKVIFTTMPVYGSEILFGGVENVLRNSASASWASLEGSLASYFQQQPFYQTTHVLDAQTGAISYPTAIAHLAQHMDTRQPPALWDSTNVISLYRARESSMRATPFGTAYRMELGKMNLATGHLSAFAPPDSLAPNIPNSIDDPAILSVGGPVIYGVHNSACLAALNTTNNTEFTVVRKTAGEGSNNCRGTAVIAMPSGQNFDLRGYENRGEGMMSPVISGNTLYVTLYGGVIVAVTGQTL